MSGQFKGVQALIANKYPTAIYVHCVSHSLNLALSNAAEVVPIRNAFVFLKKYIHFLILRNVKISFNIVLKHRHIIQIKRN